MSSIAINIEYFTITEEVRESPDMPWAQPGMLDDPKTVFVRATHAWPLLMLHTVFALFVYLFIQPYDLKNIMYASTSSGQTCMNNAR